MNLLEQIQELNHQFDDELNRVRSDGLDPESLKHRFLGRKGLLAELFARMGSVSGEERPQVGRALNDTKLRLTDLIESLIQDTTGLGGDSSPDLDVTLPGDPIPVGTNHPLIQTQDEIIAIFARLGFSLAYGPEVDTDFYNFEALNFPPNHPARDMQDTFYLDKDILLRTHTSNSQIHFMKEHEPPVKILAPGRVFRNEDISVRSYCMFHQVEGLFVDRNVSMVDLKGDLEYFVKEFFGSDIRTRFRPSYFPFTEPSAEMDVSCVLCGGKGCPVCKHTGWLEILGCGMVDPAVFTAVGYDPDQWQGYAFGMGIERTAMRRYGVTDIRQFFEGDVRFLRQF